MRRSPGIARVVGLSLALPALLASRNALAALQDFEITMLRTFYSGADAKNAAAMRSMLARPDVTRADASRALSSAMRSTPFDDAHAALLKELLFGPATAASRSDLAPAVVSGLLSRSAEVAGASGNETARAEELVHIHGFTVREIATAGKPGREGHDAAAGIRDDAFRESAAAYKVHLSLPVLERARLAGPMLAARAQAEIALLELASGVHTPEEVGQWIGAGANERAVLEKTGVLILGLEAGTAAKRTAVLQMMDAVPLGTSRASVLWIGKTRSRALVARREVLVAAAPLATSKRVDPDRLWPSSVEPSTPDASLAEVALVLGTAAARNLLAGSPPFAEAAENALARARTAGEASLLAPYAAESLERDVSTVVSRTSLVGRAAQLWLVDAPRAVAAALSRSAAGRHEAAEQLFLALSVLAATPDGKLRSALVAGRARDAGAIGPVDVTQIKGSGVLASEFKLEGHTISAQRAEDGSVARVLRDGRPVLLADVPLARVPTTAAETWTVPGRGGKKPWKLVRLAGRPEVGFVDDARVLVRAPSRTKDRDVVLLEAPSPDHQVEVDLRVERATGGIALRASPGPSGYAGVALLIEPSDPPKAFLVAFDGGGARVELAGPVVLAKPAASGHRVKIAIGKDRIDASVGGRHLAAALPTWLVGGAGGIAFAPGEKGELDVRNLRVSPYRAP